MWYVAISADKRYSQGLTRVDWIQQFKYSTTHGKDMNGTDFGKAPKELMTIAQTGGQKALLYTLLLVTEGVDETSIYNLLGW